MARPRPRRLLIALTAFAALAPGARATAAGFTAGAPFPADTTAWATLEPRFLGDGTLLAGHTDLISFTNPVSSRLALARRPAGGAWTEEFALPSTASQVPASPPQLAVAPNGAAVAAWLTLDSPDPAVAGELIQASYRSPGGTWEPPATLASIPHNAGSGTELALVIAPSGRAFAYLGHYKTPLSSPPVEVIDLYSHPAAGAWSAPQQITADINSRHVVAGVDDAGTVTVAWNQQFLGNATPSTADDAYRIVASTRFASSLTTVPTDVFPHGPSEHWSRPRLSMGPDGHEVITAQRQSPPLDMYVATGKEQAWNPAQLLVTGSAVTPLATGISPAGTAYVLYDFQGSNSGLNHVGLMRAAANGPWSAEHAVSPPGFLATSGRIAFAGEDAVVAWRSEPASPVRIGAAHWAASSPMADPPVTLETTSHELDALEPDHQGNVAVFLEDDQGHQSVRAWDATAPTLRNVQAPGTALAYVAYHASAEVNDLWSSTGPPTWVFDDGAPPVTAPAITHIFTKPGAHEIAVTTADAVGNAGTTYFPVTVGKDTKAPTVTLARPSCSKTLSRRACARRRAARGSWRTLHGSAADAAPSSGLSTIQVTAYRQSGRRYLAYVGTRLKPVTRKQALASVHPAKLTATGAWSLKLPALPRGRWTFLARAFDHQGNRSAKHASRTVTLR